ncbi:MAG: hypothetical protein WBW01_15190 [Terriglobales bacterium]
MDEALRPLVAGKFAGGGKGCRASLGWTGEGARPYASKGISRQLFADG